MENMTATINTSGWTTEQAQELEVLWQESGNIESVATCLNRSVHSVRGKLVSMGLYKKAETAATTGTRVTKAMLVQDIADTLSIEAEAIEDLAKARKGSLETILNALNTMAERG